MPTKVATAARNGSTSEEGLDEIRESLNRIEGAFNRGQHVLYDDDIDNAEGGEPADAGAVAAAAQPAPVYHSYHSTPQKHAAVSPDHQRSPAALPPRRGDAPAESQTAASRYHYHQPGVKRNVESPYQAAHDAAHRRPSGSATRARTAPAHHSGARRQGKNKKDEEELSASARAREIQEIKRESGRVPNFEEGVDESDMAQNTSIDELKERIRRELEEYQRNGPLMHRRASYQRKQRAATVPRPSAAPRATAGTSPAAGAARSIPPPSRTVKSSKVKTPKRVAPPPPLASQSRAAPTRSAAPAPTAHSASRKAAVPTSSTKPRARTAAPPASRSANAAPAAKPFWERLYRDAATQQEKRDQRAEQLRIEQEAERAKSLPRRRVHRPPAHTAYNAYYRNLQSNGGSASQSRELSANRARGTGGSNVPAQHASYVPKRTTTVPATNARGAALAKPPMNGNAAAGAPAHVAARRPSAQPAARKPLGASTPPVPLPLGPGPRAAAPAPAEAAPEDRSHDVSRELSGEEPESRGQSEEVRVGVQKKAAVARHSDSDTDSDLDSYDGQQKSTPHPYVSPLNFSGIKK